jgi:hypothetical protein
LRATAERRKTSVMMFRRALNWLIGLPLAVVAIAFAVANRQWVTISLDPINRLHPFATLTLPLWSLLFAGVFIGILAGWFVAWRGNARHRRAARDARVELIRTQQVHERERHDWQQTLPSIHKGPLS